jgi:hypothetical protein
MASAMIQGTERWERTTACRQQAITIMLLRRIWDVRCWASVLALAGPDERFAANSSKSLLQVDNEGLRMTLGRATRRRSWSVQHCRS